MSEFRKIVEEILKEDAYKDKSRLLDALNVYEKVIDDIESNLNKNNKAFAIDIAGDTVSQVKTPYGELVVVFGLDEDKDANGLYLSDSSYIQLNIPNIIDLESNVITGTHPKYNEEYKAIPSDIFLKAINSKPLQEVFVHEYTHYVDDKTTLPLYKINSTKRNRNANYFNNTNELNAHQIEWLFKISIDLVQKYDKQLKQLTPEEKLEFLKSFWKQNENFVAYYNKLQSTSKKRFLKRIYNYLNMK